MPNQTAGSNQQGATLRKALILVGFILLAIFIYHFDTFVGQWKLDRLCESEGGSRVFSKIERNVGWIVDEHPTGHMYKGPFNFKNVAFVRWRNEIGDWFDIRIKPKPWPQEPEYQFAPADTSQKVKYRYRYSLVQLQDDGRFSRSRYEVTDVTNDKVVASYTTFRFLWTKPERMILHMPTGSSCDLKSDTYQNFIQSILAAQQK